MGYFREASKEFRGYKIHQRAEGMEYHYRDLLKSPVISLLLESEKPIIFHTGYKDEARVKNLTELINRTRSPIALAHAGDLIENDLTEISACENVFIDISPLVSMLKCDFFACSENRSLELTELTMGGVLDYLENVFGNDKIVWGSDSPWCDNLIPNGYEAEVEAGRLINLTHSTGTYL